jgi:hypothetical protein
MYSVGRPYRREVWRNVAFMTMTAIIVLVLVYVTLIPHPIIMEWLDLVEIPEMAKWYLLSLAFFNLCVSWVSETYLVAIVAEGVGNMTLGGSILKIKVDRLRSVDDLERRGAGRPLKDAEEAVRANWRGRGKFWKIIEAQIRDDSRDSVVGQSSSNR